MIDANALCDRLYADALAADLRVPGRFVAAKTVVAWDDIEPYVRERAEAHRQEIVSTACGDGRSVQSCSREMECVTPVG